MGNYQFILANFIGWFFRITYILILVRVILSWIPMRNNKIVNIVYQITESIMYPVRLSINKLGLNRGMIDWTPLLTILLLELIEGLLMRIVL